MRFPDSVYYGICVVKELVDLAEKFPDFYGIKKQEAFKLLINQDWSCPVSTKLEKLVYTAKLFAKGRVHSLLDAHYLRVGLETALPEQGREEAV